MYYMNIELPNLDIDFLKFSVFYLLYTYANNYDCVNKDGIIRCILTNTTQV
jgi:hypothetical protein